MGTLVLADRFWQARLETAGAHMCGFDSEKGYVVKEGYCLAPVVTFRGKLRACRKIQLK